MLSFLIFGNGQKKSKAIGYIFFNNNKVLINNGGF